MAGQLVIYASIMPKFYPYLAPTSTENQPGFREEVIVAIETKDINDGGDKSKSISRGFIAREKRRKKPVGMVRDIVRDGATGNILMRKTEADYRAKARLTSSINGS